MSFATQWDESNPPGSQDRSLGDDRIREFKTQMRERLSVDHYMAASDDANTGYHQQTTLINSASDPAQVANALILYAKTVGGARELFSRHESSGLQQLTLQGQIWIQALGISGAARGDLIFRDASVFNRLPAGTTGQFLKTLGAGADPAWANLTGSVISGANKNLKVVWGSNSTVTLTADRIVIDDGAGNIQLLSSVNVTADITVLGAVNGLSTGAEAANTIYYIWIVAKSDGTVGMIIDPSPTAPTLPAGYTFYALMSCVGNNNLSNFIKFHQYGRKYTFDTWATLASGNAGTGAWVSVALNPANLSTNAGFVPSALSAFCFGSVSNNSTTYSGVANDSSVVTTTISTPNKVIFDANATGYITMLWGFDVLTANTLYWISANAADALYLHGFEINKLW